MAKGQHPCGSKGLHCISSQGTAPPWVQGTALHWQSRTSASVWVPIGKTAAEYCVSLAILIHSGRCGDVRRGRAGYAGKVASLAHGVCTWHNTSPVEGKHFMRYRSGFEKITVSFHPCGFGCHGDYKLCVAHMDRLLTSP